MWGLRLWVVAAMAGSVLATVNVAAAGAHPLESARLGAQIDPTTAPAYCERLRSDRSTVTAQFLSRGLMERSDGSLNVTVIDKRVGALLDCGIEVGLRVGTNDSDTDSGLPDDLGHYEDLLTQLAAHLRGRVDHFAVENETASPGHWPGSAESYFELVRAAAAALRAGNPDATVVDGTMASGAMGSVMVSSLYAEGRFDEALELVQEVQANELGGGAPVTDRAGLDAYVASSKVRRIVRFFDLLVADQDSLDAMQLHYYGPWRRLPETFDFLRARGISIPVELWEVNHRYRDGRPFVESEHAAEVARLMSTAVGEGSSFTVFSSYLGNAGNGAYGLLGFDGATDRPARSAFAGVSSELTGVTGASRLPLPGDAWGYRYDGPSGSVVGVWADPGPERVGRRVGIDATTAAVRPASAAEARHVRLDDLRAVAMPKFVAPDLVELSRAGVHGRRSVALRLVCPAASPRPNCAGRIRLIRRAGGRSRPAPIAGDRSFRLARGEAARLRLRIAPRHGRRIKPTRAIATTKPCGVGRGCRSWTGLR